MSEQTYTEANGRDTFDWNEFLDVASKGEPYKSFDLSQVSELAASWVMCACGSQCAAIPRRRNGSPKDAQLLALGSLFYLAVSESQFEEAKWILKKIEVRSSELLEAL